MRQWQPIPMQSAENRSTSKSAVLVTLLTADSTHAAVYVEGAVVPMGVQGAKAAVATRKMEAVAALCLVAADEEATSHPEEVVGKHRRPKWRPMLIEKIGIRYRQAALMHSTLSSS